VNIPGLIVFLLRHMLLFINKETENVEITFSFHLFKTTKGQMATDTLIVRQNMMRLIPTMNKTYIKPLNYYTAAVIN